MTFATTLGLPAEVSGGIDKKGRATEFSGVGFICSSTTGKRLHSELDKHHV